MTPMSSTRNTTMFGGFASVSASAEFVAIQHAETRRNSTVGRGFAVMAGRRSARIRMRQSTCWSMVRGHERVTNRSARNGKRSAVAACHTGQALSDGLTLSPAVGDALPPHAESGPSARPCWFDLAGTPRPVGTGPAGLSLPVDVLRQTHRASRQYWPGLSLRAGDSDNFPNRPLIATTGQIVAFCSRFSSSGCVQNTTSSSRRN
jgi:hypothetical protein